MVEVRACRNVPQVILVVSRKKHRQSRWILVVSTEHFAPTQEADRALIVAMRPHVKHRMDHESAAVPERVRLG